MTAVHPARCRPITAKDVRDRCAQDEAAAEQERQRIAIWLRRVHPEIADAVLRGDHWTKPPR